MVKRVRVGVRDIVGPREPYDCNVQGLVTLSTFTKLVNDCHRKKYRSFSDYIRCKLEVVAEDIE